MRLVGHPTGKQASHPRLTQHDVRDDDRLHVVFRDLRQKGQALANSLSYSLDMGSLQIKAASRSMFSIQVNAIHILPNVDLKATV